MVSFSSKLCENSWAKSPSIQQQFCHTFSACFPLCKVLLCYELQCIVYTDGQLEPKNTSIYLFCYVKKSTCLKLWFDTFLRSQRPHRTNKTTHVEQISFNFKGYLTLQTGITGVVSYFWRHTCVQLLSTFDTLSISIYSRKERERSYLIWQTFWVFAVSFWVCVYTWMALFSFCLL